MHLNQVTLPALDLEASCAFYLNLGFVQIVDTPHYARFEAPDGQGATFSLVPVDAVADSGVTIYFEHQDLDAWVDALIEKGIEFDQRPRDERYLWREAVLRDPAGNRVKLYCAGENRRFPPWRVEKRAD